MTRANDFLNTLGVTSHVVQSGITTAQWRSDYPYLGVRHDRDDFTCDQTSDPGCDPRNLNANFFIPMHQQLGVTWVGMSASNPGTSFTEWDQLGKAGAIVFVEGPNEPNNFPLTYNGVVCNQSSTFAGCANLQRDQYNQLQTDPNLVGIKMAGITEPGAEPDNVGLQFTKVPAGSGTAYDGVIFSNFVNLHNYVEGNDGQVRDNKAWYAEAPDHSEAPGPTGIAIDGCDGETCGPTFSKKFPAAPYGTCTAIPRMTTETGWCGLDGGITEDLKGRVLTDLYLDAAARGWSYTFIYQMKDDFDACGLFDSSNNPKLAATYIHNMTSILADATSAFTPTPLTINFANMPATGHSLLMQKSNGKYELAVWGEAFQSELATNVTVQLDMPRSVTVYDVTKGTSPVGSFSGQNVPLTLSDHAMILEFN